MRYALHIQNGIIDTPVSVLFLGIAAVVFAGCVRRARTDLDDRLAPMAGLVAAYIFAVQMVNFPVLPGVSGHLLGGTLAAVLVGPWVGTVCVTIVLVVQALLFADGGVFAIGLNVGNMAVIGTMVGYAVVAALLRALPDTRFGFGAAVFTAGVLSTVAAALGFVAQYGLGGVTAMPMGWVTGAIAGTHLLIGIGEGLITTVTVLAVARVRPDLVYALRRAGRRAPAGSFMPERAPVGGPA